MKWSKFSKKKKAIIIAAPLELLIIFYLLAIVIRGFAVPFYVNTFYSRPLDSYFNRSFDNVNQQLENMGFKLTVRNVTCYNGVSDGGGFAYYHYFGETVPCMKWAESTPFFPDIKFKANWHSEAPNIEARLKAAGMGYGGGTNGVTNLANLYDSLATAEYDFSSFKDGYSCHLSFLYENNTGKPTNIAKTPAQVEELCERDVSFFGGSNG